MHSFLETIRIENGIACHLEYHQWRVESVFRSFNAQKKCFALQEYIDPPEATTLYRCRIIYTIEGIQNIEYIPYYKKIITSLHHIENPHCSYEYKYENREILMQMFAQKGLCDDILITRNGLITDTSIANVALFDGVEWWTPKTPLLAGTTRQRYINDGVLKTKDIPLESLHQYKKFALLNAMIDFDIIAQENLKDIVC